MSTFDHALSHLCSALDLFLWGDRFQCPVFRRMIRVPARQSRRRESIRFRSIRVPRGADGHSWRPSTGSPAAQKAIEWAVNQMKMNGLTNVHTEPWTLFRGWTRGTATAEMIEPLQRRLYIDSLGWVGSTPADGADAEVVAVKLLNVESETPHIERFRGKVVLIEAPDASPKNISGNLLAVQLIRKRSRKSRSSRVDRVAKAVLSLRVCTSLTPEV